MPGIKVGPLSMMEVANLYQAEIDYLLVYL